MAQKVQAVPNPRYSTSPLETTGATIVSNRRVLVPPIIQGTFKGQRDYSGTNLNYITFQIADNECFIDNKCLFLIGDLTVFGPNAADGPAKTTGTTYGRDLWLEFDQSSQALITQITIGSPQGVKFEEIASYNLWANIIALHTESRPHKESDLLNYTEWSKDTGKDHGLQHFTDQQWRAPARFPVGQTTRIAMRFMFSDFMNNIDLFPLFLLRNGLQIIIYLEDAYKVFYSPSGASRTKDIVITNDAYSTAPSYLIGPGSHLVANGPAVANTLTNTQANNAVTAQDALFSPLALNSNVNGTATIVPCYNTAWVDKCIGENILSQLDHMTGSGHELGAETAPNQRPLTLRHAIAIPVSMYELNQIVWSGFTIVVPHSIYCPQDSGASLRFVDQFKDNYLYGMSWISKFYASATFTVAADDLDDDSKTDTFASTERDSYLKQLDVDAAMRCTGVFDTKSLTDVTFNRGVALETAGPYLPTVENLYLGLPLWSYHPDAQIPYVPYLNTIGAAMPTEVATANNSLYKRGAQMVVHCGDAFPLYFENAQVPRWTVAYASNVAGPIGAAGRTLTVPATNLFNVRGATNGAASVLSLWSLSNSNRQMRYEITNPQLLLDLVKPDAQNFLQWQQAFSSPSGIAIKYKKPIYRKLSFAAQSSGLLQIQVPINVRSLTGLVFVIQDPVMDTNPNDLLQCLMLANLSTFQNRRITEQYVQIGGQQYPVYMYQMLPDGTNRPYWEAHLLESEKLFAVAGNSSFSSLLSKPMVKKTRNLLAGGFLGATNPLVFANMESRRRVTYTDSSGCVYAMNLAKDWVRTFTTGVDSSQAGSIAVNLYFKDPSGVSNVSSAFGGDSQGTNSGPVGNRSFNIHMFALCDCVVTLQESANLVRY